MGKNGRNEIVKALSTFSVQWRLGLCLDLGCVFGVSALLEDLFSAEGLTAATICFVNHPVQCVSVKHSKHILSNSKVLCIVLKTHQIFTLLL